MNVLSLFDGMSCCHLALIRAGIRVDNYYAAEIDRYAIEVTNHNFPDTVQLGDVTKWADWDIDWSSIDLVTGGFPCQAWSMAGKQLGDKDERGMLFWTMLDIMARAKLANPNIKFLIENVKMKHEFEAYITRHTTEALGQVHKTLINSSLVSAQNRNRYYWTNFEVTQPEDRDIHLCDILEGDYVDQEKSYCIDANYFKGGNLKSYFEKHRRQLVFCGAFRGRYDEEGIARQRLEIRYDGKTNAITTVMKDNNVVDCTSGDVNVTYRKLTPTECERLQTVPEGYTSCVSNTQRYKLLGNGWTVDVIAHMFEGLKE